MRVEKETAADSWFGGLWRTARKSSASEPENVAVEILAFEVASMMSKVVNLWQCLGDRQIIRLREDIVNSFGVQRLVSEDEDYLMDLFLVEVVENLRCLVKSVAILGKKCTDPVYHDLEQILHDPVKLSLNWRGWDYRLKKMEKKVKKMERFIASTTQLSQELEVLAELEQSLKRMQAGADLGRLKLLEFQQKVIWQRQEVRNLRGMSPWVRTYDYNVRILLRSIFTILERVKHVFGINQNGDVEESFQSEESCNSLVRSQSISSVMHSSIFSSENNISRLHLGPLGRSFSSLGEIGDSNRSSYKKLHPIQATALCRKQSQRKNRRFGQVGPFKGCMTGGSYSPVMNSCVPSNRVFSRSSGISKDNDKVHDANAACVSSGSMVVNIESLLGSRNKLLNAPPSTLGHAALALHYANVIILIEKLAASPHLISLDARDDLYNVLPASIRTCLRAKLKGVSKILASSICDETLAAEWSTALARILEWLSPLAHNTTRWHSERNFEKQHVISCANVLLVQTLYFADRAKTEAAITELLVGLNYLSRYGQQLNEKTFPVSSCGRFCDDYAFHRDGISHRMISHTI